MSDATSENPLLHISHPIAFDHVRAEHVEPAIEVLLGEAKAALANLEADGSGRTYDNTLSALERVTERLELAMGVVGHLESVATSPELRVAYNAVQPPVSAFFSSISVSEKAYLTVKDFAETEEARALDATRARFLKKTLSSFKRQGAELDEPGKQRLSAINVELSEVTTKFSQNVLDSTNAYELVIEDEKRLAGLPQRAIDAARHSAEGKGKSGYRFTLQGPSLLPVLSHLHDGSIREQIYRAFNTRASAEPYDNRELVKRILNLRQEKAVLLGFENFVDLVLEERMAHTGKQARAFVDGLRKKSEAAFRAENEALEAFRKQEEGAGAAALAPWDVNYYSERQRVALYDFEEEQLRPYFSLDGVLTGMFELVKTLYGIDVRPAEGIPVWHESVRTFRIVDADGSELGIFYADFFPREEKRDGAWMNAFLTGLPMADGSWSPHVGLICANVTPPVGDKPALLGHREVETVFHEFGHLLHHMLSRVDVRSMAGTSVAWDFVELPSQIMENFCWERRALDMFARHHETGEPIPHVLFERMSRARTYRGANFMMRQLGFANLDLSMHMDVPTMGDVDIVKFASDTMQPFSAAKQMDGYAMVLSFGHLFGHPVGYAGGYYSYKWAEVLDADAFSRFKEHGVFSEEVGSEFRQKILAKGDSRDPMELFEDFMGRKPDERALLERCGIPAA